MANSVITKSLAADVNTLNGKVHADNVGLNTYHVEMGQNRTLQILTNVSWPTILAYCGRASMSVYTIFGKGLSNPDSREVSLEKIGGTESPITSAVPVSSGGNGITVTFAADWEQISLISNDTLTLTKQ